MITLRPRGPRVTFTARASFWTPSRMCSRASASKAICLAIFFLDSVGRSGLVLDDREDVRLGHDQVLVAQHLDLGAGVGGEQHAVADLDGHLLASAVLVDAALADGEHAAFLRLVLGA